MHHILLIQNDPAEIRATQSTLLDSNEEEFKVECVATCAAALSRLEQEVDNDINSPSPVAAILLDPALPDSDGLEAFQRILTAAPQTPILILVSQEGDEIGKNAVKMGAQDYLRKSFIQPYQLSKAIINMIERAANAEALFDAKERAQVTLNSIGDAVMSTNVRGDVTYLNAVAEFLTGWPHRDAVGRAFEEVFRVIDAESRRPLLSPMLAAIRRNKPVSLPPNSLLIRRNDIETPVADSAAPIHNRRGQVTGAVMVFRDVSISQAAAHRMSYLAQHDALTDLPNRILLSDRLSQAVMHAQRHQQKLALLFIDVDRFKFVNDSLGHAIGDRLLQLIAQRLLSCVRATDTVSRQGGDEFVILLSEVAHADDALASADKMLLAVSRPFRIDEHDVHVSASIGLVIYPDDGVDADELLKHADFAMYHAKDCGRGNYQFFKPEMNAKAAARQAVQNDLRNALEREEFELRYQPIVNLRSSTIVGAEALIRWNHPERGLIEPSEFIPVAEECGLIVTIGRWVLRHACFQVRAWRDAGLLLGRIAVNVSAIELRDKNYVASVREILLQTGFEASGLELEVTETALLQDADSAATILRSLKVMGAYIALDDFGTGYSSLSHLKRFPIDTLKIDHSFIRDLTADSNDASIVRAVISMGRSLRMRVVAEGVETLAQCKYLRRYSCPEAQGFYFNRPLSALEFARVLEQSVDSAPSLRSA
ncbi:MAG: EAL domain-containing protein [Gammaproteobacteria bacterium]